MKLQDKENLEVASAVSDVLEIPVVRNAFELAVQIPGGAMEGAAEFIDGARLVAEATPTVSTGVDEAFDLT